MIRIKRAIVAAAATAVIALAPVTPAAAYGRGFGPFIPFGLGHGVAGAVFGLVALPLLIASAVAASEQEPQQAQPYGAPYAYAPPPAYAAPPYYGPPRSYAPPPVYYAPRPAYYPRAYGYSPAPRTNYAPRPNYAAGPAYHQRGYAYPRR